MKSGKTDQALQVLSKSSQRQPRNSDLALRTAMVYEVSQQWEQAKNAYERVLALDSTNATAQNNLAWLLAEHAGNIDVALKLAQQAKERSKDNVNVTNTIGWIYYKKNSYQMALQYLRESATKEPGNPMYQYHLGMVYLKLGKNGEARQALEKALKLDPKFPQAGEVKKMLAEI